MSFLAPLYALGALAIAAPILFHLIRRMPKGEIPFSSLMFLTPSPPRLTRRSRLDNVLLLLLRAAALILLAAAFARPFLREAAQLDLNDAEQRRILLLIDISASMRRGDLWNRAIEQAKAAIAACKPGDPLAIYAFDATSRPLLTFTESATLDPAKRRAVAEARLSELKPTWAATHLGQALIDAVAAIEDVTDSAEKAGRMPREIVLIGDLQQGSHIDALGSFEWPKDVELSLKTVTDPSANAGLQWLAASPDVEPGAKDELRARVSNDPFSRQESFMLSWVGPKGAAVGTTIPVYVPPGESRVVRIPRPIPSQTAPSTELVLRGDASPFDNTIHLADEPREQATVVYIGPDAPEQDAGRLYYLERVFQDSPRRTVKVVRQTPAANLSLESERSTPLIVLASETTPENLGKLKMYVNGGGTLLFVLSTAGPSTTLSALGDATPIEVEEARDHRGVLLAEIAFDHPLFAPFAPAQFNDFTKIHFWKYRRLSADALPGARIVAHFEGADPAILEKPLGKGRLIVFTSGWDPADSQLARSSKFVPMMAALLDMRNPHRFDNAALTVLDRVPLPPAEKSETPIVIHKPDGTTEQSPSGSAYFTDTDQPGVYQVDTPSGPRLFAVNLDPTESKTAPLGVETLEQFGCRMASATRKSADRDHRRQLHNAELEGRQKLWRWIILTALGVLIVETWLAGRLTRSRFARVEALAT
jgi:Aerotolerance regulator N-terminal/von Willebrand factor type A domain